jgi:hypothetical protein
MYVYHYFYSLIRFGTGLFQIELRVNDVRSVTNQLHDT